MVMMCGYSRYVAVTRAKKMLSLPSTFWRLVYLYNDVFHVTDTPRVEFPNETTATKEREKGITNLQEQWTGEDLIEIKNFFQTMDKDSLELLGSLSSE
jgi:hypothetical protein